MKENKLKLLITLIVVITFLGIFFHSDIYEFIKNHEFFKQTLNPKEEAISAFNEHLVSKMDAEYQKYFIASVTHEKNWSYEDYKNSEYSGEDSEHTKFSETGNFNFPYTMNYLVFFSPPQDKDYVVAYTELFIFNAESGSWEPLASETSYFKKDDITTIDKVNYFEQTDDTLDSCPNPDEEKSPSGECVLRSA